MTELPGKLRHCAANKGIIMNCKFLLSLSATLAVTFGAHAQLSSIATVWAKTLDTEVPDMGIDFTLSGDALYYLSTTGSLIEPNNNMAGDPTASVYYDGEKIATGAAYTGSGYNNNFSLVKTDRDGHFVWTVYSTCGEIMSNNGGVVPAPDGGVVVSALFRHTDNLRTSPLVIVDATGQRHTIDWTLAAPDAKRHVRGIMMKVTVDGAIDWMRLIDVSTTPQNNLTEMITDAIYFYGMETDARGNIYLSGRYVNPVTFEQAGGQHFTLTPHNIEGWDGDTQKTRGDLFVAKFSPDGFLTATLTTAGVAEMESSATLARAGNDFILSAIVKGDNAAGSSLTLGGHAIELVNDKQALVTARFDADLNVKWVRTFTCADEILGKSPVVQNNHVNVVGDDLWITGMGNFDMTCGDYRITTATPNTREGFIVKLNAADGNTLGAVTQRSTASGITGISSFLGGFENESGTHFYTYGYSMGGQGVFLCDYDAATLAFNQFVTLVAGGGQPTAQKCVADGDMLYTVSRGRTTPDFDITYLKPIGYDTGIETRNWAALHCAFKLPFNVKADKDDTSLIGDVNGDGIVSGADVTALYEVLLNNARPAGNADVNRDSVVSGADVTALYQLLLN